MPTSTNHQVEQSLTNTLVIALSQCQDQVRQLAEQQKMIDDLKLENQRLKEDLDQFRGNPKDNLEARYAVQFQEAFKQVAEKQVEIDRLRTKLRNAKNRAQQHGLTDAISSSPVMPLVSPEAGSLQGSGLIHMPVQSHDEAKIKVESEEAPRASGMQSTNSRKRLRSPSPVREPLKEVSGNVTPVRTGFSRTENLKPRGEVAVDKAIAAIPEIAEDGDQHIRRKRKSDSGSRAKQMPDSIYNRLGNLLEAPAPASPSLLRARSSSPVPTKGNAPDATSAGLGPTRSDAPVPHTKMQLKGSSLSFGEISRSSPLDRQGKGQFRNRPLDQLGLMHFKVNPAANAGLDYAYNQVVRGGERRCFPGCRRECCAGTFKAIATSLPGFSGRNGQQLSDDELLLEFLGPNSEEKIKNLTKAARQNLIHEARTKLVADAYGKMHRDAHERGKSPPGFWRTDMPGSQEMREDREIAKAVEKEEISRRYNEAMKGGGRWIFADE